MECKMLCTNMKFLKKSQSRWTFFFMLFTVCYCYSPKEYLQFYVHKNTHISLRMCVLIKYILLWKSPYIHKRRRKKRHIFTPCANTVGPCGHPLLMVFSLCCFFQWQILFFLEKKKLNCKGTRVKYCMNK